MAIVLIASTDMSFKLKEKLFGSSDKINKIYSIVGEALSNITAEVAIFLCYVAYNACINCYLRISNYSLT